MSCGGADDNMGGVPASPAATPTGSCASTTVSTTCATTDSALFQQLLNLSTTGAPQLGPGVLNPAPTPGVPKPAPSPGVLRWVWHQSHHVTDEADAAVHAATDVTDTTMDGSLIFCS